MSKLKKEVAKLPAVIAGGDVLIAAGLYHGAMTGATELTYASLNADGSTSTVNGATGSNTISSAGGGNLFNRAAVGYLDANGAFHVLVVCGDDVNKPTTAKYRGAYYYRACRRRQLSGGSGAPLPTESGRVGSLHYVVLAAAGRKRNIPLQGVPETAGRVALQQRRRGLQ